MKAWITAMLLVSTGTALAQTTATIMERSKITPQALSLTEEWDKIFPKSAHVAHRKVTFVNRYGITIAGDLYLPIGTSQTPLAAVAVSGPFGAVKEQCSGIYAQAMAERGFAALAFDPSFTGESGGTPRQLASPDINTEDFSAAVDYLSTLEGIDPKRIGVIGICGWGGMALNAAAADPRIKATVTSTMYDMSRVNTYGYNDIMDSEARYQERKAIAQQRTDDIRQGYYAPSGRALPSQLTGQEPQFVAEYFDFYKTARGFHPRSINSNGDWNKTMAYSFMNLPLLSFAHEIRNAVLIIHGEKAHSRYFSETAYSLLRGDNKELLIIPGANHVDLYDNLAGVIPYDKIEAFLRQHLH